MPFTLTMPKLSPTMEEGVIAKWHKKVGDHVEAGEHLIDVSTDKATVEYETIDGGWLRKIIVAEDGEAQVNQPIAILTEEKDESIEGYVPEGAAAKVGAPPVEEVIPQPQKAPENKSEEVVTPAPVSATPKPAQQPEYTPQSSANSRIIASPLAKKLAAQEGLDLTNLQGSGPGGRIMKKDLENASSHGSATAFSGKSKSVQRQAPGSFAEEALTPMRKVIAQRLQEAKATIPHFYIEQTIDASNLVSLREQLKNGDVKITYNDVIIKASALALKLHPDVNSGFASKGGAIVRFNTIDISVAVSIKGGLLTPIVRYADDKDVREISLEVKELSKRAKEGKLQPNEFQGGSFTISNLGMYGVSNFYAIINPPQAAILAVSGILDAPVIKNGQVVAGQIMNLSLSVDHRVIDGVAAASFMHTLKRFLENPAVVLL